MALSFVLCAYTTLGILAALSFGIDNIEPSIFENIQDDPSFFSVVLRCLFLIIFICNIPFLFCAAKLATLSIIALCHEEPKEYGSDFGAQSDGGFDINLDTSLNGDEFVIDKTPEKKTKKQTSP